MNRVLTIAVYSGESKSTTFIERLIYGLANQNVKVYIFGIDNGKSQNSKNVIYKVFKGKYRRIFFLLKYWLLLFIFKYTEKKRLDKLIKDSGKSKYRLKLKYYPVLYYSPKIFHLQWAKGISDWIWVEEFGIKLVLSLRGAHINYSPILDPNLAKTYRALFPKVSAFHAVSHAIANEAKKYNASSNRINIIKSGLDLNELPYCEKQFKKRGPLKLIMVGRDHWIKNYKFAIDSINDLKLSGLDIHLKLIGVGKSEHLLFHRDQLNLNNDITICDNMPFNAVKNEIIDSDIMLLTSLKEGIANVILEAMALGTIVVSTNCGGIQEVIKQNKTGFLVPSMDVKSLSCTIFKVAQLDREAYTEVTNGAREFIESYHSMNVMVEKMTTLYKTLLEDSI